MSNLIVFSIAFTVGAVIYFATKTNKKPAKATPKKIPLDPTTPAGGSPSTPDDGKLTPNTEQKTDFVK